METLTPEKGLKTTSNNSGFFQDAFGFIWISSPSGLNKYSGQSVRVYQPEESDPASLVYPIAASSDIFEDRDRNLWFCNTLALMKYAQEGDCFEPYQMIDEQGSTLKDEYHWLYLDSVSQRMYVCTERKLYVTSAEQLPHCLLVADVNVSTPASMRRLSDGSQEFLQVRFRGDYFNHWEVVGDGTALKLKEKIHAPDGADIRDVISWDDTLLLIGLSNGLRKLNLETGNWSGLLIQADGKTTGETTSIDQAPDGTVFLVTRDQGVFILDVDSWQLTGKLYHQTDASVLPFAPVIEAARLNKDGNFWMGVEGEGIYHFNVQKRKLDGVMVGDPSGYQNYTGVSSARIGGFWVSTYKGVLWVNGLDTTYYPLPITGDDVEKTTFVHEAEDGTVWVGTLEWLFRKRPEEQTFSMAVITPEDMDNLPGYICVQEDDAGNLLFGTNDRGILYYSPGHERGKWLPVNTHGVVCLTLMDSTLIFGNTAGDLHYGILSGDQFTLRDQVSLGDIPTSISKPDQWGGIYVGTFGRLFYVNIESGKLLWRTVKEVPVSGATSVELDNSGAVWTSGSIGLFRYEPGSDSLTTFSVADGMQSKAYTFASSGQLAGDLLAFCGPNGINLFDPSTVKSRIPTASPVITQILINGLEEELSNFTPEKVSNAAFILELNLRHHQNDLGLSLASREYAQPGANEFRYALVKGRSAPEVYLPCGSELQLSGLAPGRYLLSVQASNADGLWGEQTHRLRLNIAPPWNQTWWAYGLYTLLMGLIFYLVYRWRLGEVTQKAQLKTSEAEARRLAAETTTSILRLQMNPHFIFNSLNSIDDYILDEAPIKAHDYLVMFAELMRDILNRSTQPLTRLDQEIEMLEKYVEAERMRVGEGLRSQVELAGELDTVSTWIPTMILQPFVENAIWHGIGSREGGGLITLRFELDEPGECLVVSVEDDGRGRKNAKKRTKEHGSKALGITRQRLELLNAKLALAPSTSLAPAAAPQKARYDIHDLTTEDGDPIGTRVVLYLPLIYPEDYESRSD